jgi:N-hydroxyarylamine O-acetyltransferase
LKRIKSEHLKSVSFENLKELHSNNLLSIPWENYSVAHNDHLTLDLKFIYEKLIVQGRGGWCYELNQLFAWLLEQLGYKLKFVSCRNFVITEQKFYPWKGHVVVMVNLNDRDYLVDVGHSGSPRYPLEFILDKVQKDVVAHYRIAQGEEANIFTLHKTTDGLDIKETWPALFQFNTTPRKIEDFQEIFEWTQTKECPRVYNRSFCIKHDGDCLKMLIAYTLTIIHFKDGIEVKREEREIAPEKLVETIYTEMNVKIESDFVPRNLPQIFKN